MVLRTENLVKKYGQRTVVNHVSINVTQGEIVGLLGPNGAGKTTTFYMTVGLIIDLIRFIEADCFRICRSLRLIIELYAECHRLVF